MAIVKENWEEFGLNRTLSVLDLPKSTWYYWKDEKVDWEKKHEDTRQKIEQIIEDNPGYGRPRITPELADRFDVDINHKLVGKILRNWEIKLMQNARKTAKSPVEKVIEQAGKEINLVRKRMNGERPVSPFEITYTDFTNIKYDSGNRKAMLMPVIDHDTKLILGWSLSRQRGTEMALKAWSSAKQTIAGYERDLEGIIIHHDQDSVYKSDEWIRKVFLEDRAQISFAINGAKDNPFMESFNGHFKKPNESQFLEAETLKALIEIIQDQVQYWNADRRHSSLGQIPPEEYLEQEGKNGNL